MSDFTTAAFNRTDHNHTSTFLNGEFISQEPDNSMAREAAVKAELIEQYGPVRLVERIIGGNGRVVVSYRTVADR